LAEKFVQQGSRDDHVFDDVVMRPVRTRKEKTIPAVGLLFVNPADAAFALNTILARGGKKRFLFNSTFAVSNDESFFVAGPAVGAPMAVLCLEKLIVLGARGITLVGWCGALQPELGIADLLLPGQALCGEGTSHYYSGDPEPKPSADMLVWLRETLSQNAIAWREGRVWSTDAPYRESREMLARLRNEQDIAAIDMEYSALCTVARFRGVEFAACMLVSDELWRNQWKPGYATPLFRQRCQELAVILMDGCRVFNKGR
jgi:uridine phosphorylase